MSRARFAIAACVAVIAVAVAAAPASAATTASQTVKFTNQAAVQLTLTPASIDLGTVDPLGTATSATPTVATVFANAPWHLQVKGTGNFTSGAAVIPDSRLTVTGSLPGVQLSAANQNIALGTVATPQTGTATNVNYALSLLWNDPVSATPFSDTLTYTVVTP